MTEMSESKPPFPPFTAETAIQKVQAAEDAWNTCDPERVSLAYTVDSDWRNRDEHMVGRAEIVADEAILKITDDHTWGEAMHSLIEQVRQGRPGDGIVAAIERVGTVLAEHFPRSAGDINEIPDKLIEL